LLSKAERILPEAPLHRNRRKIVEIRRKEGGRLEGANLAQLGLLEANQTGTGRVKISGDAVALIGIAKPTNVPRSNRETNTSHTKQRSTREQLDLTQQSDSLIGLRPLQHKVWKK
jgi:hypothetical protein